MQNGTDRLIIEVVNHETGILKTLQVVMVLLTKNSDTIP